MIKGLGKELVDKEETALAELVKNAYDADCHHLHLPHANGRKEEAMSIAKPYGLMFDAVNMEIFMMRTNLKLILSIGLLSCAATASSVRSDEARNSQNHLSERHRSSETMLGRSSAKTADGRLTGSAAPIVVEPTVQHWGPPPNRGFYGQ